MKTLIINSEGLNYLDYVNPFTFHNYEDLESLWDCCRKWSFMIKQKNLLKNL